MALLHHVLPQPDEPDLRAHNPVPPAVGQVLRTNVHGLEQRKSTMSRAAQDVGAKGVWDSCTRPKAATSVCILYMRRAKFMRVNVISLCEKATAFSLPPSWMKR
mmetsp:Transcript_17938/g.39061  ORF Transcript_17938/g.39061 Transcript_17938/m.39061 type:complete len:104 (-) Transcript_17938:197-508(-)